MDNEMIIITDAHISKAQGNHTIFFKMLESLEKNNQDLIFLGDIFDLWVALPRYEERIQQDFIAWCRKQKSHRTIGYMEGNHEYYLANERASDFTWCSMNAWWRDATGVLFVHGDRINRKDKNYLAFRKLVKNRVSKFIICHLPFGPKITLSIKQGLKKTNTRFRLQLPEAEIEKFAVARFAEGVNVIFMGHFHQQYRYRNRDAGELHVLPDWFSTQKVTIYHHESKKTKSLHWEEVGTL
jgi:UDP-2,3-diacylglucosamine hydrolase